MYNNLVAQNATVAQLVEQRIRNAQVVSSSLTSSSKIIRLKRMQNVFLLA